MIKKNFQTIVLVVFGLFGLIGVAVFALQRATPSEEDRIPQLTIWGTLPAEYFAFFGRDDLEDPYVQKMSYREIRADQFDQELVEALADGNPATGPDIVVLSGSMLYEHRSKLQMIPYEEYSASQFNERFLPLASIFTFDDGVAALPAVVDPLVMYWNEPLLTSHGYADPPRFWDEMRGFSEEMTETEEFLSITQSGVSLGTFDNIDHAKDLISLLLMQSGSPIVTARNGRVFADFSQTITELSLPPAEALNFYTEFADPARTAYSWNTSLPSARSAFLAGDLALYFGYASERDDLVEMNPNLSFSIARVPQVQDSPLTMTAGDVYGFAALKEGNAPAYAKRALWSLASQSTIERIDSASGLPSVHRSLLAEDPADPTSRTLVQSALMARTWLDPDDEETEAAFRDLVNSIRSNQYDPESALSRLRSRIDSLLD